ncbi:MAG: hypothetical protein NVSMB2_02140 [Chloroflexota bacterium]
MTQQLRERALDDTALGWVQRGVWIVCVGVYLTVFVSGVTAGGEEVLLVARATGLTLVAAVLGRIVLRLAATAEVAVRQVPTAMQEGPVGSLVDLVASTNVAQHNDEANAA